MTDPPSDPTPDPPPNVGSLAEEALKLLGVLTDWAGDSPDGLGRRLDEHLATGAPECQYCPVCRAVHVVREAGPEVRVHLAAAATSLMQAAAGVLAAAAAGPEPPPRRGREPNPAVQHIDLTDDPDDPDSPGAAT